MKKIKSLILLVILAIAVVIFAILYFNEKSGFESVQATLKKDTTSRLLSIRQSMERLAETAPITDTVLRHYMQYFRTTLDPNYLTTHKGIFPYGSWVDKSVIMGQLSADSISGFMIVPLRYDTPVTEGQDTFQKDQVNFAIILTKTKTRSTVTNHDEDLNGETDYNHPCPYPPCN